MSSAKDLIFSNENFGFGLMLKIQLQSYSHRLQPQFQISSTSLTAYTWFLPGLKIESRSYCLICILCQQENLWLTLMFSLVKYFRNFSLWLEQFYAAVIFVSVLLLSCYYVMLLSYYILWFIEYRWNYIIQFQVWNKDLIWFKVRINNSAEIISYGVFKHCTSKDRHRDRKK